MVYMTRDQAEHEVKSRYAEYLRPAKKKGTYVCIVPNCQNGTGEDGDGIKIDPSAKNPYTLHCFKCGHHGSIVDFVMKERNCTTGEAFKVLYDYFNIIIDENRPHRIDGERREAPTEGKSTSESQTPSEGIVEPLESKPDFMEYYGECREHLSDPEAQAYLTLRGISQETASRYWLGYDRKMKRLVIPAGTGSYVARTILPDGKPRYYNPAGVDVEVFNKRALYGDDGRPVFVTEGAVDALSIIEAGGLAVAINSASNVRKFLNVVDQRRPDRSIIICMDNDDRGRAAAQELAAGLRDRDISAVTANICGQYKDPNERLVNDREGIERDIQASERRTCKPDNTAEYITMLMGAEIAQLRKQSDRKTGFQNLDREAGSIYAGLYVIGGISSVGKTTFVSQMADQMAAQGQHVLFFSLEQSRLEMVSKSISRITAQADPDRGVTSLQIRTGAQGTSIKAATEKYLKDVGDRVSIIEANLACTPALIREYTEQYIRNNGGIRPTVIVDYLQVLQSDVDPETGRKPTDPRQSVDHNVTALKRMSRALEIPVFVLSSVSRSNYLVQIDFESFKESGGIEYTADVVWGLQLAAIHDTVFDGDPRKDVSKKRDRIAEAKEATPREIELVCLKNRYGKSRYSADFTYYPQYDLFEPAD